MAYRYTIIHLLLLGYVLSLVNGQAATTASEGAVASGVDHVTDGSSQGENDENIAEDENDEENDEDSAIGRLQNVTTIEDFISLLQRDGNPVNREDILSNMTNEDGKIVISGVGRMATPDNCSPRDTTVRLSFDNNNPNVVYFPRCTKIERCGGCCPSHHLECVPSYTERVSLNVIKAEVPLPGASHLDWKGEYYPVIVERHVTCRIQCTLTPQKCGPKKEFQERQCECKCKSAYQRCDPPHVWDPEECECKCAEVLTCCNEGEQCPLTFLTDTCECGIDAGKHVVRSDENSSSIESSSDSLNNSAIDIITLSSTSTPETVTTSTVATSTATTENPPSTRYDPCPGVMCPPNFQRYINPNGSCVCRTAFSGGFRRRNLSPLK